VPLPERVVPGKATARVTDGVLVVSVPKLRPKERGKPVPVSVR
jgi:HSP20 family molecular chaperone IbpA